jgi:hypothetical protein
MNRGVGEPNGAERGGGQTGQRAGPGRAGDFPRGELRETWRGGHREGQGRRPDRLVPGARAGLEARASGWPSLLGCCAAVAAVAATPGEWAALWVSPPRSPRLPSDRSAEFTRLCPGAGCSPTELRVGGGRAATGGRGGSPARPRTRRCRSQGQRAHESGSTVGPPCAAAHRDAATSPGG